MFRGIMATLLIFASFIFLIIIGLSAVFLSLPDVRMLRGCLTTELFHVHLCPTDSNYTPYSQISPYIIGAVVMSEDASFYSHPGVDFYEMKESVKTDLSRGQFARGASTITQQLAKNVFLSNSKNILRKLEEIYLAFQIEKYFSKFNIITLYLNVVEFGDGIYGVKAACHHYFDKEPGDVTPEESAFLAFLLPNPKKYSQSYKRHQLTPFAEKTIRTILHKMLKGHKITDEEHDLAVARMPQFPWGKTFESGSPDEVPIEMGGAGETTTPGQSMGEIPQETPSDEDNFNFDFTTEEKQ